MKRIKTRPSTIAEFWTTHTDETGFEPAATDQEPGCMICGFSPRLRHELLFPDQVLPWSRCRGKFAAWNKSGLVRGHLHSAALGGSDSPDNLLMICEKCNRTMPQFRCRIKALQHLRDAEWVYEAWLGQVMFMRYASDPILRQTLESEAAKIRKRFDEIRKAEEEAYAPVQTSSGSGRVEAWL